MACHIVETLNTQLLKFVYLQYDLVLNSISNYTYE